MQIECDEIVLENVRLDIGEHSLDVVRVDGCREMVVDGCVPVPLHAQEHG